MSKRDHVREEYYGKHLHGDSARFQNNPAVSRTALLERMLMRTMTEMAVNRFKWSGMPDSISVRFMELTMFYRALAVFYFDPQYNKFLALQGNPSGNYNFLNDPTAFFVTGNQFVGKTLRSTPYAMTVGGEVKSFEAECVPVWSNYLRIPDLDIVTIYASKIAEFDRTIEINGKTARRTKILVASDNQRLSMVNLNRQIDEGQGMIQLSNSALMEGITALDLGSDPDAIEKLSIVRSRLWSEAMGLLGINNANQDKKERLVAAEVGANDEQIEAVKAVNLNARQEAAYKINKRYGLSVSVEYRADVDKQMSTMDYGLYDGIKPTQPLAGITTNEVVTR